MILKLPWLPVKGITLTPWLVVIQNKGYSEHEIGVTLKHEAVHQQQQKKDGWFNFLRKYFGSTNGRIDYEAEAYVEDVLDLHARRPDLLLSTITSSYAWVVARKRAGDYNEARRRLVYWLAQRGYDA